MFSVSGEITAVFSILFKLLRCSHAFEGLLCACLWCAAPNHLCLLLTHTWLVSPACDLEMGAGGGSILLSQPGPQVAVNGAWGRGRIPTTALLLKLLLGVMMCWQEGLDIGIHCCLMTGSGLFDRKHTDFLCQHWK